MKNLNPILSVLPRIAKLVLDLWAGHGLTAAVMLAALVDSSKVVTNNNAAVDPLSLPSRSQFKLPGTSLIWVPALPREGHAEACARLGFGPSSPVVFLSPRKGDQVPTHATSNASVDSPSWSADLLSTVATGLGLELERPGGVRGCCVPGMWCGRNGCYTLAVGNTFANHGGYVGMPSDEYSVYTCVELGLASVTAPSTNTTSSPTAISSLDSSSSSSAQLSIDSSTAGERGNASSNATSTASNSSSITTSSASGSSSAEDDQTGEIDGSSSCPPPPSIESVNPDVAKSGEALTLVGSGFGEDREAVRVMIGGRECRDPELCHRVCRPCDDEHPCDFDEMCTQDDLSKDRVCLPICDGPEASCPCDHRCLPRRFEVQGMPHSLVVNLCRPPDADPNFLCHGSVLRNQERIQCIVPVLAWDQAETEASQHVGRDGGLHQRRLGEEWGRGLQRADEAETQSNIEEDGGSGIAATSVSVAIGNQTAVWAEGVEYAPNSCRSVDDCDDGDACSLDACVKRKCVHNGVAEGYGCQAQPASVKWRGDAYRYFQIVDKADPAEQSDFLAAVKAEHRVSSVTAADDYPVEFHNWGSEFPIYGTKYEDIYISPNGALFVPPWQSVTTGGLSAVSPSTEAFFPVLLADWNPMDSRASSVVLLMIDEKQFSVLYQDVFLFRKSADAKPSTFSITVFPDGSLRYRYMHIGDRSVWTVGVSGNSFISPTIRDRHVRQAEFVDMSAEGRPIPSMGASDSATPVTSGMGTTASTASTDPNIKNGDSASADDSADSIDAGKTSSGGSEAGGDESAVGGGVSSSDDGQSGSVEVGDGESDGDDAVDDDQVEGEHGDGDLSMEATLCRAPTIACLAHACGQAGTDLAILWEGFGCQAAALNVTFTCSFAGVQIPATTHGFSSSPSTTTAPDQDEWGWAGGKRGEGQNTWGPAWEGGNRGGGAAGGGLVCRVPRLDWIEDGDREAMMVPVEVLWSLPGQTSDSSLEQVAHSSANVAVRGLSITGDNGPVNSHVLAFRYYREDIEAPDCGCSPSPRQTSETCDSCLVCGGSDSTKDCGGFCHGEAYTDPCGDCAGGMTGVIGCIGYDEYGEYLDGPTQAALLSLSQSIMMLVALSIMTAFFTTCLFVVRALMIRGILAVEGDHHGTVRRRLFGRRLGLSPSEMACLELVEYHSVDASAESRVDEQDSHPTREGDRESGEEQADAEAEGADHERRENIASFQTEDHCAICLNDFENGELLRKMPCRHLFHQECVDEWLHLSISCPLCKRSAREGVRAQSIGQNAIGTVAIQLPPRPPSTSSAASGRWPRGNAAGGSQQLRDGDVPAAEPAVVIGRQQWWLWRLSTLIGRSRAQEGWYSTVANDGDGIGVSGVGQGVELENNRGVDADGDWPPPSPPSEPGIAVVEDRGTGSSREVLDEERRQVTMMGGLSQLLGVRFSRVSSPVVRNSGSIFHGDFEGRTHDQRGVENGSTLGPVARAGRDGPVEPPDLRATLGTLFGFRVRRQGTGGGIRAGLGLAEYELAPVTGANVDTV